MEFKKITFIECLFAAIVISICLIAMVLISGAEYRYSTLDNNILKFSFILIYTSLILILYYYLKESKKHQSSVLYSGFKDEIEVIKGVNFVLLLSILGFILDSIIFKNNSLDTLFFEIACIFSFVAFLAANLVLVISISFIEFKSPYLFKLGEFKVKSTFWLLYYLVWIAVFIILFFILFCVDFPNLGFTMLLNAAIMANLLTHKTY